MSRRLADLMMYAALAVIATAVIWQTYALPNPFGGSIGSGGFPTLMAGLAILLCALGALRSLLSHDDERLEFEGSGKIVVTLLAMVALFLLWQVVGYFFVLAFVFLSGLLCFYASDRALTWRIAAFNIAGSAVVIALIKAFFTYVLYVRF